MSNLNARNLCRHVYLLNARIDHLADFTTSHCKISREHLYIIELVLENPGITQKELIHMLRKEQTSVSRTLKKLIDQDLIVKTHNANDLRASFLNVTEKGQQVVDELQDQICNVTNDVLDGLSQTDKERLTKVLTELQKLDSI